MYDFVASLMCHIGWSVSYGRGGRERGIACVLLALSLLGKQGDLHCRLQVDVTTRTDISVVLAAVGASLTPSLLRARYAWIRLSFWARRASWLRQCMLNHCPETGPQLCTEPCMIVMLVAFADSLKGEVAAVHRGLTWLAAAVAFGSVCMGAGLAAIAYATAVKRAAKVPKSKRTKVSNSLQHPMQ